jgi:predicted PurR-regulated permease PerM
VSDLDKLRELAEENQKDILLLATAQKKEFSLGALIAICGGYLTILVIFFGSITAILDPFIEKLDAVTKKLDKLIESKAQIDSTQDVEIGQLKTRVSHIEKKIERR